MGISVWLIDESVSVFYVKSSPYYESHYCLVSFSGFYFIFTFSCCGLLFIFRRCYGLISLSVVFILWTNLQRIFAFVVVESAVHIIRILAQPARWTRSWQDSFCSVTIWFCHVNNVFRISEIVNKSLSQSTSTNAANASPQFSRFSKLRFLCLVCKSNKLR